MHYLHKRRRHHHVTTVSFRGIMKHSLKFIPFAIVCSIASTVHGYTGKASIHPYSGLTTAARGVHRGAILLVWDPKFPSRKIRVRVVDACGRGMRPRWGRILDLSPLSFRKLYGSTQRGVATVSYRILKDGKGAWCGKY